VRVRHDVRDDLAEISVYTHGNGDGQEAIPRGTQLEAADRSEAEQRRDNQIEGGEIEGDPAPVGAERPGHREARPCDEQPKHSQRDEVER
jgi:hypothetical protein